MKGKKPQNKKPSLEQFLASHPFPKPTGNTYLDQKNITEALTEAHASLSKPDFFLYSQKLILNYLSSPNSTELTNFIIYQTQALTSKSPHGLKSRVLESLFKRRPEIYEEIRKSIDPEALETLIETYDRIRKIFHKHNYKLTTFVRDPHGKTIKEEEEEE